MLFVLLIRPTLNNFFILSYRYLNKYHNLYACFSFSHFELKWGGGDFVRLVISLGGFCPGCFFLGGFGLGGLCPEGILSYTPHSACFSRCWTPDVAIMTGAGGTYSDASLISLTFIDLLTTLYKIKRLQLIDYIPHSAPAVRRYTSLHM